MEYWISKTVLLLENDDLFLNIVMAPDQAGITVLGNFFQKVEKTKGLVSSQIIDYQPITAWHLIGYLLSITTSTL